MRGTLKRIPDRVLKESLPEMGVQLRNQVNGWEQVLGCRVRPRLSDLTEAPIENERRSIRPGVPKYPDPGQLLGSKLIEE